jgi:hypothetical protein
MEATPERDLVKLIALQICLEECNKRAVQGASKVKVYLVQLNKHIAEVRKEAEEEKELRQKEGAERKAREAADRQLELDLLKSSGIVGEDAVPSQMMVAGDEEEEGQDTDWDELAREYIQKLKSEIAPHMEFFSRTVEKMPIGPSLKEISAIE